MGRAAGTGFEGASAKDLLTELFVFGAKQARACLFPGIFISILLLSSHVPLFGLARYDFVFLGAVLAQVALVALGIETRTRRSPSALSTCSASRSRSSRPIPP